MEKEREREGGMEGEGERETEREREGWREREREGWRKREREGWRKREREGGMERARGHFYISERYKASHTHLGRIATETKDNKRPTEREGQTSKERERKKNQIPTVTILNVQ